MTPIADRSINPRACAGAMRVPGPVINPYLSFSLAIQVSASAAVGNTPAAVVGRVPVTAISTANVPSFSIAADMPTTVFATVLGIPVASILKLYLAATFERHEHKWLAN
jgi:hypothetical protein